MKITSLLLLLFISACTTRGKPGKPYEVRLAISKSVIKSWNDLKIKTAVTALADTGLIIPVALWTSDVSYPEGDFCFELEFKSDTGGFIKQRIASAVDHFKPQDSVRRLNFRQTINYNDNLAGYYALDRKGFYRFRVIYHASKFNHMEDIASDWVSFELKNDKLYLTREARSSLQTSTSEPDTADLILKLSSSEVDSKQKEFPITVTNRSNDTLYYIIGLDVYSDTGLVNIVGDIKSLGQNELLVLSEIPAKSSRELLVRISQARYRVYKGYNTMRLRLMFSRKQSFINTPFKFGEYFFVLNN